MENHFTLTDTELQSMTFHLFKFAGDYSFNLDWSIQTILSCLYYGLMLLPVADGNVLQFTYKREAAMNFINIML